VQCAYTILSSGICAELVLCDVERDKLTGEVMDLNHAGAFLHANVTAAGPNFEGTENSDICIITAGVRQRVGEDRRSLLERNFKVFQSIVPTMVKLSPEIIILVVSNPCDALTYIAWKLSGLPSNRVIGSGTFLDSSRFRVRLAEKLGVNPQSVHGLIIGEHGDSSVPVWSGVNIAGVPLNTFFESNIHEAVVKSAYDIIKLKGYTNWAIGAAVSQIVHFIFMDSHRVVPITTYAKGEHGIEEDVFLSLPCVIGRNGVVRVLHTPLSEWEKSKLRESARIMRSFLPQSKV